MKKLKRLLMLVVVGLGMTMLTACGDVVVKYDLASEGYNMTYSTVNNMKSSPSKYVNKTFRIKGKIGGTSDDLNISDKDYCCSWSLQLCTDNTDVNFEKKIGKTLTILGTYKKINGEYVLDVIGLG